MTREWVDEYGYDEATAYVRPAPGSTVDERTVAWDAVTRLTACHGDIPGIETRTVEVDGTEKFDTVFMQVEEIATDTVERTVVDVLTGDGR